MSDQDSETHTLRPPELRESKTNSSPHGSPAIPQSPTRPIRRLERNRRAGSHSPEAEQLEEMFRPGENEISGRIDEVAVRPYGDWAIVTGKTMLLVAMRAMNQSHAAFHRCL